jgi:hypothetical protein
VLRFDSGPSGAGFAPYGLLVAAAVALALARGTRLAWAIRACSLIVAGFALVWLPAELSPSSAVAAPEAGLALAGLGVALAAALAVGSASASAEPMQSAPKVGWRRGLATVAVVGIVVGGFGFVADAVGGRWGAPDGDWAEVLSFTQDATFEGQFRILWVGDSDILPLDPAELDAEVSWSLTRNGAGDARELWRAPVGDADDVIDRAIDVARVGDTTRLGRLLAPAGVRYVVVPQRNGPDGARGRRVPSVTAALAGQLDLARLRSEPGLVVYQNESWAPARALTEADVPTGAVAPLPSAATTDLTGSIPVGDAPVGKGTVLLAEANDPGWSASSGGTELTHDAAFGWVNAWTQPSRGAVAITHDGQGVRYLLLGVELLLWVAALVWWSRGRKRARAARVAKRRRERLERAPRPTDFALESELAGYDDLEGFWEEQ